MEKNMTFALFFGNRGFFPGELVASAREEVRSAVQSMGCGTLEMPADLTRFGAVESIDEGLKYARFLEDHRGEFDGVILSLPNFGDESGAATALKDCGVPILIQAYPDEAGKMDVSQRRDAFCGKISIANVFVQSGIKFTVFEPHTCHPNSPEFKEQLKIFMQICNIVKKMKSFNVGSVGIRPTAFKTIRYDEVALQKYGINVEAFDLYQLFDLYNKVDTSSRAFGEAQETIRGSSDTSGVTQERMERLTRLYLAMKTLVKQYHLDAIGIRCWNDMQDVIGIAPCLVNGILSQEGIPVACETDICNAIAMVALQAAAGEAALIMDWNNNFENDPNKCILFHCGNVPPSQMAGKGKVVSHALIDKGREVQVGWGCNQGRVRQGELTYLSSKTSEGKLSFYIGEGQVTDDTIEEAFFGCAGVVEIPHLQKVLLGVCKNGYRHHVSLTIAPVKKALIEALTNYLGYEVEEF